MSDIILKEGERIDDLQRNGYRIIQNPKYFCFGMDAVLLSAFAAARDGDRVLDMCTGSGVIPILMAARYPGASYVGLEIQEAVADMASRSVLLNGLGEKLRIDCGDIKNAKELYGGGSFDAVTVNPPYMNESHGLKNPDEPLAIARHEVMCTLADVIKVAASLLKSGGHFYMVHRPHRLAETFAEMRAAHIEPKRLRFVHSHIGDEAKMILIEGTLSGGAWLKVEPPLIIYNEAGEYTDEVRDIYEK